ncbi:unnamed protein product [Brassica oleracea]
MLPSCAQFSAKSILTGALTPERAFVHSCVHGYHGSWLDIIHPFSTLGITPRSSRLGRGKMLTLGWMISHYCREGCNRASISKT